MRADLLQANRRIGYPRSKPSYVPTSEAMNIDPRDGPRFYPKTSKRLSIFRRTVPHTTRCSLCRKLPRIALSCLPPPIGNCPRVPTQRDVRCAGARSFH